MAASQRITNNINSRKTRFRLLLFERPAAFKASSTSHRVSLFSSSLSLKYLMALLQTRRFALHEKFTPFSQLDTLLPGSTPFVAQLLPTQKYAKLAAVNSFYTWKQLSAFFSHRFTHPSHLDAPAFLLSGFVSFSSHQKALSPRSTLLFSTRRLRAFQVRFFLRQFFGKILTVGHVLPFCVKEKVISETLS